MKKANNFPVQSANSGIKMKHEVGYVIDPTKKPKVIADETNNSEDDIDKGIMNVDVIMPVIPMHKITIEIPNEPEENDGGIGQGSLA